MADGGQNPFQPSPAGLLSAPMPMIENPQQSFSPDAQDGSQAESQAEPVAGVNETWASTWIWRVLPAGMRRRWWLFRLFDLIARYWPVIKPRRGLLVVRMDGIGDMVLFRGALDHYAAAFGMEPSEITVLGCASWGGIAGEIFSGYRVHVINEHAFARRPLYRFRVSLMVRRLAPAVTVCDSFFRRAMMADSLTWVSGAPETVVSLPYVNEPTRTEFTYYLSQVSRIIHTGDYPTHEVVRHFRFVSAIAGREIPPAPPRITWPDRPPPLEEGAPYVVLNPGSNEPGRRWPYSSYLAMAERLLADGYRVVFIGTAKEKPKTAPGDALGVHVGNHPGAPGVIDLVGRTRLDEVLDLMAHAAAVLTNDTGPAHLSIALGAPTLVIVGGGHFGGFFPYPDGVAPPNARFAFHRQECYHCFWRCHKRPAKSDVFPCIGAIGEDQVWRQLVELLAEGKDGKAHGR